MTEKELIKNEPKLKKKKDVLNLDDSLKRKYYLLCWFFTEKQPLFKLKNYKKRCWKGHNCYELDHIFPISIGYKEKILPHLIGSLMNLRFIEKKENREKSFNLTEESILIFKKFKQIR